MNVVQGFLLLILPYVCFAFGYDQDYLGTTRLSRRYSSRPHYNPKAPPFLGRQNAPQCSTTISVEIEFVADDGASLFICGVEVRRSNFFDELQAFRYEGPCGDFIIELRNNEFSAGVALLATVNGVRFGTTALGREVPGTNPLFGIAAFNPPGDWRNNPPDYPFDTWTPAVVVDSIIAIPSSDRPNFERLIQMGALPIGLQDGFSPVGVIGIKIPIPFCP